MPCFTVYDLCLSTNQCVYECHCNKLRYFLCVSVLTCLHIVYTESSMLAGRRIDTELTEQHLYWLHVFKCTMFCDGTTSNQFVSANTTELDLP